MTDTLTGFADWKPPAVSLPFRQFGDSADSAVNPGPEEPTLKQLLDQRKALQTTDISLTVSGTPDPVAAGTQLTYALRVKNLGLNPASSLKLVSNIPAQLSLVTAPSYCAIAGNTVTCPLAELQAGQETTLAIISAVPPGLVYDNGAPLTVLIHTEVHDAVGEDSNPANNIVDTSTKILAMADLRLTALNVLNPPLEMQIGEEVVIALQSVISSLGPSSPMDTKLQLDAATDTGAAVSPTSLVTLQPHMETNAERTVLDYSILKCLAAGRHSVKFLHRINPQRPDDINLESSNDQQHTSIEFDCKGRREVKINVLPGRWPNEVHLSNQEMPVAVMTTKDGEYSLPAFDAATVVQGSLRFGSVELLEDPTLGVGEMSNRFEVADQFEPMPPETARDGDLDVLTWFDPSASGLKPTDKRACVTGLYLKSGIQVPFFGCGVIKPE